VEKGNAEGKDGSRSMERRSEGSQAHKNFGDLLGRSMNFFRR